MDERRLKTFLLWLLLANVLGAQPEPPPSPQEWRISNLTFKAEGALSITRDLGHLYAELDIIGRLRSHNQLVKHLQTAYTDASSAADTRDEMTAVNTTFLELRSSTNAIAEQFQMICLAISCEEEANVLDVPELSSVMRGRKIQPHQTGKETKKPANSRPERQAIALALLGIGISLFDTLETRLLRDELFQARPVKHLKSLLTTYKEHIDANERSIKDLLEFATVVTTWKHNEEVTNWLLSTWQHVNSYQVELSRWLSDLITLVLSRKVPPGLFTLEELRRAFFVLKQEADHKNLRVAYETLQDIFSAPTSFVSRSGKIDLMIHIPLSSQDPFQLYRSLETPIQTADGALVIPLLEKNYLAIDPSLSEYVELDSSDLEACQKLNHIYLCDIGLSLKTTTKSCLLDLYLGYAEDIQQHCTFSHHIAHDMITVIAEDTILVTPAQKPVYLHFECVSGRDLQLIHFPEVVKVPPSCVASTPRAIFTTTSGYDLRVSFVERPVHGFNYSASQLRYPPLVNLVTNLVPTNSNPLPFPELENQSSHNYVITGLAIFSLVATVAAAAAISWPFAHDGWRRRQRRQARLQQTELAESQEQGEPCAIEETSRPITRRSSHASVSTT